MFDSIRNTPELFAIICHGCSENNAIVEFDNNLLLNDELNDDKVLILKPDSFYHSKNSHNPPPSPDCLILINCVEQEHYDLYLIELKDVKNTTDLKYKSIAEKFNTMIKQFFPEFSTIFNSVKYKTIAFYLVTTYPKGGNQLSPEEYRSKIASCALDAYASQKPLRLFNKAILIQPVPSPFKILAC